MIKTYLVTIQRVNMDILGSTLSTFKYQADAELTGKQVIENIINAFNKKDTCGYKYLLKDIKTLDDYKYFDEVLKGIL